ncbi:MAG: orotate phosphoribosyltransferase [Acidimicrobiia bacterium]|nr:MAG: orotate phosphoribosyltransferase [Acidimicrobiia bacterium]
MSTQTDPKGYLVEHLRNHSVRTDGPYTLRSGESSDWYIDARHTTFDGWGAILVGEVVLAALDSRVTAVGGMTLGADPIAVATAIAAGRARRPMQSFSVRKEAKDHGTGGRLAGPVGTDDTVAVLEDTTTTGAALSEAIEVLIDAGIEVVQAIALVDRSGGAVGARLAEAGIAYLPLISPEELGVGP